MIHVYGSKLCPDCVLCCRELTEAGVVFEYHDFAEDLRALKIFLSIRDEDPVFAPVKENGKIGIPCILREDGSVTLSWQEFL